MTRPVVTVGDRTSVVDATMLMIERKIGGLPVVDQSRRLLGIITETDLLKALAAMLRREERGAQATGPRGAKAPRKKAVTHGKSASKRPAAAKPKAKPPDAKPKGHRKPLLAARKAVNRVASR